MAKLYPPYIEGTIPAFFEDELGTVMLTVPLSMNKAVNSSEVKGFELKIKTAQAGTLLGTFAQERFDIKSEMAVWFDLSRIKHLLTVGQYYKIQIAYINKSNAEVGYYSTVGVTKYTTKPDVTIDGLEIDIINTHQNRYLGTYSQLNKDTTERVYSSRFDIYDIQGQLLVSSGDILHNRTNDINNYESQDGWNYNKDLKIDTPYYIKYTVTTLNNLTVSSPTYRIMQKKTVNPEIKVDLQVEMNFDNGFVDLNLIGYKNEETGLEEPVVGSFIILRSSEDEGFTNWSEVFRFNLNSELPSRWLWRDFTVEQGKTYLYALQQYNDYGLYSNKLLSNKVYADFEDAFLYDGTRQLRIRYNPKVSSFKNTIYETKIDTIGGKHPFIFRNGITSYKEFPISGMISYYMDEDEIFMSAEDYGLTEKTTNLINTNIAAERRFKLEVLDWLNNGSVKLFRSPSEGNYLVRLLNISMTPADGLGRMLHTFNATAYEVAEHTFENLEEFKIIDVKIPELYNLQWQTMNFVEQDPEKGLVYVQYGNPFVSAPEKNNNNVQKVYEVDSVDELYLDTTKNLLRLDNGSSMIARTVIFKDMMPGDRILIVQDNEYHLVPEAQTIAIGVTGSYQIESPVGISGIYLIDDKRPYGNLLFSYYVKTQNIFNLVAGVEINEIPVRQFIGIQAPEYPKDIYTGRVLSIPRHSNIVNLVQDVKTELVEFYQLQFAKRPVEAIYKNNGMYYHDEALSMPVDVEQLDAYYLYKVYEVVKYNASGGGYIMKSNFVGYLDGYNHLEYAEKLYDNKIYINDDPEVDITETEDFYLKNFDNINYIKIGLGVMLTATYQTRVITYNLEVDNTVPLSDTTLLPKLHHQKQVLAVEKQNLKQLIEQLEKKEISIETFIAAEKEQKNAIKAAYDEYITILSKALTTYKEDNVITI